MHDDHMDEPTDVPEDADTETLRVPKDGVAAIVVMCLNGDHAHFTAEFGSLIDAANGLIDMANRLRQISSGLRDINRLDRRRFGLFRRRFAWTKIREIKGARFE